MGEEKGGASSQAFKLLGDQPHLAPGDPLDFARIADDLTALVLASRGSTPFTLGIEATWGMGKSSLMGLLQRRLAHESDVVTIQFNAWTAEEGRVLEAFVKTVLSEIGPGVLSRALYRQKAIGILRVPIGIVAAKLGLSSVADTAWEKLAEDPTGRNELRQLMDKAVARWRRRHSRPEGGRLLCVFVDDLDRCSPTVVLEVLEAMKLYLDVPGMVFVLGYDEDIVSEVVLRDKGYGEDRARARSYLEKFIQISYRIPRADDGQSRALVEALLSTSGVADLLDDSERQLVVERSAWNPRRIKRFINNFILVQGLDPRLSDFAPRSLVRVLLLQMYFPQFSRLLERSSERDPLEEFLEYEAARTGLLRRRLGGAQGDVIEQALKSHQLAFAGALADQDPDDLLRRLEQEIPVEFPALASSEEFVDLVRSINTAADWPEVRLEVSRGALANVERPEAEEPQLWRERGFNGLSVLWMDDNPMGNQRLREMLLEGGAMVKATSEEEEMAAILRVERVDVLISDIGRGEDPMAGFRTLEGIAADSALNYPRAVIFFTTRMTPVRIEKAKELDAEITADPDFLLNYLASRLEGES